MVGASGNHDARRGAAQRFLHAPPAEPLRVAARARKRKIDVVKEISAQVRLALEGHHGLDQPVLQAAMGERSMPAIRRQPRLALAECQVRIDVRDQLDVPGSGVIEHLLNGIGQGVAIHAPFTATDFLPHAQPQNIFRLPGVDALVARGNSRVLGCEGKVVTTDGRRSINDPLVFFPALGRSRCRSGSHSHTSRNASGRISAGASSGRRARIR